MNDSAGVVSDVETVVVKSGDKSPEENEITLADEVVTSDVPSSARPAPSVISCALAVDPVGLPSKVNAFTCWIFAYVTALSAIVRAPLEESVASPDTVTEATLDPMPVPTKILPLSICGKSANTIDRNVGAASLPATGPAKKVFAT